MNLKLPTAIVLSSLLLIALAASAAAQQKRQTPVKPPAPPAATPAPTPPPPTFDTLLAADTYKIYGEVRSVGQFIKSPSVNEILEPILTLAGPPKEFRTVVKWLNRHAEEVTSSRMLVAGAPGVKDIPEILIAIEFASAEDAAKFQQKLNGFLQVMLPTPTPDPTAEKKKNDTPPVPQYHMQQAGSLILITPRPFNLKKLRPAGSKLLSEDANFRVAHNRFSTESIFVFVNVAEIEKEDEERRKHYEEEQKKAATEMAANSEAAAPQKVELVTEPQKPEEPEEAEVELKTTAGKETVIVGVQSDVGVGKAPDEFQAKQSQEMLMGLTMLVSSITRVEAKMPAAVGVAVSLDGDSFDVRALLINPPGEKSDPIPFLPILAAGPAIVPEASSILPADTESLVTMSLDLQQIYTALSKPEPTPGTLQVKPASTNDVVPEPPIVSLEKRLKLNLKDELLPLLGSEIVVSVPMTGLDWFQPPKVDSSTTSPSPSPSPEPSPSASLNATTNTPDQTQAGPSLVIALSLRDKEGMRTLLPKLIDSLAFKGASSFAQTERREDTELVSYANIISYAFIGNFLVISPDTSATRHVVDSYLKRETLSGDPHFKNYTRWQPRQVQGQIYVSPSLMESYRKWVQQPTASIDDQTRAFLTRFSIVAQPVTYALSNEGFGPLHELHVPKNLVLLLVAATSGALNTPPPTETQIDTPPPPATKPAKPANPF